MNSDEIQQQFLAASAMLYGIALRYTGCSEEAEDVVQDAFVAVWRVRDRLAALPATDAPRYFAHVVRNMSIDHLRRNEVRPQTTAEADDIGGLVYDESPTPYEVAASRDELALLRRLAATLPDKQCKAFTLCHFEGREVKEAALLMGETETNVRMLLSRARMKIKEKFKPYTQQKKQQT